MTTERHDYPISDDITLHPRYLPGEGLPFWNPWSEQVEHAVVVDIAMVAARPCYQLASVPGRPGSSWVSFAAAHAEADRAPTELEVPAVAS